MANNGINKQLELSIRHPKRGMKFSLQLRRHTIGIAITASALILLVSALTPLVSLSGPSKAAAQTTGFKWVNAQTIEAPGANNTVVRYLDDNPDDNTHIYFKQGTSLNCPNDLELNGHDYNNDIIDIRGWNNNDVQPGGGHKLYVVSPSTNANDQRCTVQESTVSVANTNNSVLTYTWIDKQTIRHFRAPVGDNSIRGVNLQADSTFKLTKTDGFIATYTIQGGGVCTDTIVVDTRNPGQNALYTQSIANDVNGGCDKKETSINIAQPTAYNIATAPGAGGGQNGGNVEPPKNCETKSADSALGWLICGFINTLDGILNFFDGKILEYLTVDMAIFSNPEYVTAWGVVRNIALLVLVPVMLIMVISTALEVGPFDAYTVKKTLPRFLVAVLFIVASLPIMKFFIGLSNVVQHGIIGLITSAFGEETQAITLQSLFNPNGGETLVFSGLVAGTIGVAAATGAVTAGVALSYALIALVALGLGYLILQIRIVIITALPLFAVFAILVWIFKGNDKLWSLFKTTSIAVLILGPIFGTFVGVSRVLAYLATDWWLKLIFYVGVYFLLTYILQAFGGVIGTLTNKAGQASRGFMNSQAKMRSNSREKAFGKFRAGERGPGWNRKLGFTTGAFMEAEKKGRFIGSALRNSGRMIRNNPDNPKTGYYAEAVAQQHKLNEMRYGQTERAKATQEDDGYMQQALTYRNAAEARERMRDDWGASTQEIERSIAAANATGGFSAARQNYATRRLAATGTGYANIEQMQRTVARVAGNNRSMAADLLGEMNAVTKGVGRHDLAAGFGNQLGMYDAIQQRGGYDAVVAAGPGGAALTADEYRNAHTAAARDVDAVTLLRDKNGGVRNMSEALGQSFTLAQARANDVTLAANVRAAARDESVQLAGYIAKLEQSGAYASLTNVETAGSLAVTPTSGAGATALVTGPSGTPILVPTAGRNAVQAAASSGQVQINPVTGRTESLYATRMVNGRLEIITDPQTGQPILAPNLTQDQRAAELMRRHGPQSARPNPNDPNY